MSATTKIQWATHSWNPWIGCTKVSPGCAHCYAERLDRQRFSKTLGDPPEVHWGKGAPRHRTSASTWRLPLRWNRQVRALTSAATRIEAAPRVFPSLCDWLDPEVPLDWLADLIALIRETPRLNWLLLTKRPERFPLRAGNWIPEFGMPANLWYGISAEDQVRKFPWAVNLAAA